MDIFRFPSFCPVCDRLMTGSKSTSTYYDYGCCVDCHIEFVEGRVERWVEGWRPDAEQVSQFIVKMKAPRT